MFTTEGQLRAAVIELSERDPRAMNHMDPDTREIHARLEEWAKHCKQAFARLGYSTSSYYEKWALLGIAPNPGMEPTLPERPAHVDRAVRQLGDIDRSVIWRYYMQWRPGDALWKELHGIDSKRRFECVLKRARFRVEGYLIAIENI